MGRGREPDEPAISVVLPAYNEERNIRQGTLSTAVDYLRGQGYKYEMIVVDDGSGDRTAELVEAFVEREPGTRLIRQGHQGKAYAVASGVEAARGRYVLFMDTDLSTSLEHLADAIKALDEGADIVLGSREAKGAVRIGAPWTRRWLGKAFNYLIQLLLLPGFDDTQCGFKGFRREVAQELFRSLIVFASSERDVQGPRVTAFDVELLVLARRRGHRIKQIPVTWRYVHTRNVRPMVDSYRMLREALLIWLNKVRGRYNLNHGGP